MSSSAYCRAALPLQWVGREVFPLLGHMTASVLPVWVSQKKMSWNRNVSQVQSSVNPPGKGYHVAMPCRKEEKGKAVILSWAFLWLKSLSKTTNKKLKQNKTQKPHKPTTRKTTHTPSLENKNKRCDIRQLAFLVLIRTISLAMQTYFP